MSEDQKIEVGTVVMLKSGGPWMTVVAVEGDAAVCEFFNYHGEHDCLQTIGFPVACLDVIDDYDAGDDGGGESLGNVVILSGEERAAA